MDFFATEDFYICLIVGAIVGLVAGQLIKGRGLGPIGSIAVGLIGGVIGGVIFDVVGIIDLGDLLDPIVASVVGSVVLLAIASVIRR